MKAASFSELVAGGYTFLRRRRCPWCGEQVAFFRTPKGKKAPFVLLESGKYLSHFATCSEAARRKREKGEETVRKDEVSLFEAQKITDLREEDLCRKAESGELKSRRVDGMLYFDRFQILELVQQTTDAARCEGES